jgi:hypothetical protein
MPHFFKQVSLSYQEYLHAKQNPVLKKLKVGEQKDVYLSAAISDKRFNTNIKARLGQLDEMSWGFMGTGPLTLALNILYTYTGDEKFARAHALEFRAEYLQNIDKAKSYWIPSFMVECWIIQKEEGDLNYVQ